MIQFTKGNILDSKAHALVNTVNTVGVMGKGIALQFKNQYPNNYKLYRKAFENKELEIGKVFVTKEESLLGGEKWIVNFPTKKHWRYPSEYEYIEKGLVSLKKFLIKEKIQSIAIPPLGAGNGGLDWNKVKEMIVSSLEGLETEVIIYEPTDTIKEELKKERVKLTPARAMMLSVLYDLVRQGEFVSEFAAEKVAYFLQKFGAQDEFKLDFQKNFYGPYSGKVRHVLYHLNGSYVMGYSSKDKKPFEELDLIIDAEKDVMKFLNDGKNEKYLKIVQKTKNFLNGFYSPFGLELLSTIDFIKSDKPNYNAEQIQLEIDKWSSRKSKMFSNSKFVDVALKNINRNTIAQ